MDSKKGIIEHPGEAFEPEPRAKLISLKLVMENSLTKSELDEYNKLAADEVMERARILKTLHIEWQNIGEIAMLEPFESTEVAYMQYNRIERIEGLECLPLLQFLALQGNRIKKLENLKCLTALECLDLSKNQIESLDEDELPGTINMLCLKENPCAGTPDYRKRICARLPDLGYLDGEELGNLGASGSFASKPSELNIEETELEAGEKGLSAYWRKNDLQAAGASQVANSIEAYSIEALGDVDGFTQRVADAAERSKARQAKMEKSSKVSSSLREDQLAAIIKEKEHFANLIKEKEQLAARIKEGMANNGKQETDAAASESTN